VPILIQACIVILTIAVAVAAIALVRVLIQARRTAAQLEITLQTVNQRRCRGSIGRSNETEDVLARCRGWSRSANRIRGRSLGRERQGREAVVPAGRPGDRADRARGRHPHGRAHRREVSRRATGSTAVVQPREETTMSDNRTDALMAFLLGAAVGAGVALLLAQSGEETAPVASAMPPRQGRRRSRREDAIRARRTSEASGGDLKAAIARAARPTGRRARAREPAPTSTTL
jgi:hypothetical protein